MTSFLYIFLLVDCFKWAAHWCHWRFTWWHFFTIFTISWLFQMGGALRLTLHLKGIWVHSASSCQLLHRPGLFIYTYDSPGEHFPLYLLRNTTYVCWNCFTTELVIPRLHWKAKSSLCALAVYSKHKDLPGDYLLYIFQKCMFKLFQHELIHLRHIDFTWWHFFIVLLY